jgi:hypothetical protein
MERGPASGSPIGPLEAEVREAGFADGQTDLPALGGQL